MLTTYLDATLTASKARVSPGIRAILTGLLKEALVVVMNDQYHYRVDFGPNVQPQIHIVSWSLVCNCSQGEDCPAVTAVKKHLKDGSQAAETPPPGYWPPIPHKCPVCAGVVHYNPQLSSKYRGLGWTCENDKAHYWIHLGQVHARAYKGKKVAALDNAKAFPFPEEYDPNREYPPTVCRHCGQPL
ncbi:MAG TPA: hypothetical protein VF355_06070 [Anaerolineaceae bacterium]